MSDLIISVSGLRGIIGETLTPDVAARFVAAFAAEIPAGPVVVGRDGRGSGRMLASAVISALNGCGRDCIDADVAATPTIGVLTRHRNPAPYNGIKLFGESGRVLDAETGARIRDGYFAAVAAWVDHDQIGTVVRDEDPHQAHLEKVLSTVDGAAIEKAAYRVLIDSNHGAGGLLGKRLLQALGCQVVAVGDIPDGNFAHIPEPTADNLAGVSQRAREEKCAVGFCQDPDADRLALVDANGRYIGEEYTLALCVQRALSHKQTTGPIVINGATSGMSERLASEAGVPLFRSAVGEANVADMMIANQASYGGEGNGGPMDPRVGYVRDSFVGMAQVLALMTETNKSLAELADALPRLHIHKAKAEVSPERLPDLFAELGRMHRDAELQSGDGLRLAWPDKWLLVRGSNTEPIVRLIAEAETESEAVRLCRTAAELL